MRKTLLIITALMLIVGCSSPEPINAEKLIEEDGLKYHPDTKELYSGVAVWYHENGQKGFEGTFKDGERIGKLTYWYENGQKYREGTYKDGVQYGLYTAWHENGQKGFEGTFKDGSLISVKCWDEDGNEIDCDELE